MPRFLLLFCLLVRTLPSLSGQDAYHSTLVGQLQAAYGLPSSPAWLLPDTETATFANAITYGAAVTNLNPAGQAFSQGRAFAVQPGANPWDAGHLYKNTAAIGAGDKCLIVVWLRSTSPDGRATLLAENTTTYHKEAFAIVRLNGQWAQYLIPFEASAAYAVNTLQIGVQMAWQAQTIELGGAAVLNYKNTVSSAQLPLNLHNDYYPGSEPDAPWRAEAATSIDQLRKAHLTLKIVDAGGQPVGGAAVQVEMQQHAFKFGTAVISNRFGGGNAQDNIYEEKMLDLDGHGHGFNEVVFENDLKWPAWEQHWYSSQAEIAAAIQWLHDRRISVRGHNLQWPGWGYSPPDLESHQNDPAYLLNRIHNHVQDILTYPGVGTECTDWDVLNEITQNNDYAGALAGTPGFVTGREWYAGVFEQAHTLAPDSRLYLNDYVAIERGDNDGGLIDLWKSRIDELVAAGAPVQGLGFQGHFGAFPTGIPRVREILEDFWQTYGLEAKVTEYDMDKLVPPQTQAGYMRDILTVTFAHPSMRGFLMWGFWDGAHWLSNAPVYNEDWSLKPSGEAFIEQVFHRWWTDTTLLSDNAGLAGTRAFKGRYRIQADCGGVLLSQELELLADTTLIIQLPCVSGVQEAPAGRLRLLPAGTPDDWQLAWDGNGSAVVLPLRISDALGRIRLAGEMPIGGIYRFRTEGWPAGVYFLTVGQHTVRIPVSR